MKNSPAYCFELEFAVRDSEVDMFGVVNNSVYLRYLEHTRHTFLKSTGIDAAHMQQLGFNLVVTRIEIDYKQPLRSGDLFVVKLAVSAVTRVRFVFLQDIYHLSSQQLTTSARIVGTAIPPNGRPGIPDDFYQVLHTHLA
ncbi:MAG: acyl-CoA thioesterase [SAR324 cluster bacterium]|nr:acyl-CoA thioesterase [SAR324 cluster bacterium]